MHIFIVTCGFISFGYILKAGLLNHRMGIDLSLGDAQKVFSKRLYQLTLPPGICECSIYLLILLLLTLPWHFIKVFIYTSHFFERYWNYFLLIWAYFFTTIIASFNEESLLLLICFYLSISSFEFINFGALLKRHLPIIKTVSFAFFWKLHCFIHHF